LSCCGAPYAGADVHSLDSYNGTGLIRAAERGHVDIIRELLETDIKIDHVNRLVDRAVGSIILATEARAIPRLYGSSSRPARTSVSPMARGDAAGACEKRGYSQIAAILKGAGTHDDESQFDANGAPDDTE